MTDARNQPDEWHENLMYLRIAVETLWVTLAASGAIETSLALSVIDRALTTTEGNAVKTGATLTHLRRSLETLAGRIHRAGTQRYENPAPKREGLAREPECQSERPIS